jgi:hypothetical protein
MSSSGHSLKTLMSALGLFSDPLPDIAVGQFKPTSRYYAAIRPEIKEPGQ